jgi:His-Xaa-Ser system protein HxsD
MDCTAFLTTRLPDGTQLLTFDSKVYRLSAIKKATYKYGGLFHILIEQHDQATEVRMKPKESCVPIDKLVGEFCNEVLDQELRETVAEETVGIRNLLLAQAFSKTSLIDPAMETAEYDAEQRKETVNNE